MTEHRVHLDAALAPGVLVNLSDAAFRHVVQVLRLRAGDSFVVFDGRGREATAVLEDVQKRAASVRLESAREVDRESPLRIVLAQGVSKGDRMDYTIQKAVELGVTEIVPLLTERCVVRPDDAARWERKQEHWRGVLIAACEQSGRTRLPQLQPVQAYRNWLTTPLPELRLALTPSAGEPLPVLPPGDREVLLLVGPEGGLSDNEIRLSEQAGFRGLRLGPRILRTETAGVAAIAILQARWGDLTP